MAALGTGPPATELIRSRENQGGMAAEERQRLPRSLHPRKVSASPGPKRAARESRGLYHLASIVPQSADCQACDFPEQERVKCSARSGCPGELEDIVYPGKVPPGLPKNSQRKRLGTCHLWAMGARCSYQLAGNSDRDQRGDRGLSLSPSPFPSTPDKLEPGRGKKGTAPKQTTWRGRKYHFPTAGPPAFLPTEMRNSALKTRSYLKQTDF